MKTSARVVPFAMPALLAGALLGCESVASHTVPPPASPQSSAPLEIGPILTDQGVDLGPAVAQRIRERGLGDAHVVEAPSGNAPYVAGNVKSSDADRGNRDGHFLGAAIVLALGGMADALGITFVAIGHTDNGSGTGDNVKPVGYGLLGVGVPLTIWGIYMLTRPSQYMDAKVSADLTFKRGGVSSPLQVSDEASIRYSRSKPEAGGSMLLDGVINGMCTEAQQH
jgi:hypothetical protein